MNTAEVYCKVKQCERRNRAAGLVKVRQLPDESLTTQLTQIDRKIGCDKSLPSCENCRRTQRVCDGYNVRLSWPSKVDGRRKQILWQAGPISVSPNYMATSGRFTFLNTIVRDFDDDRIGEDELAGLELQSSKLERPLSHMNGITSIDGYLISYCMCNRRSGTQTPPWLTLCR
jgi:hypothetical protein